MSIGFHLCVHVLTVSGEVEVHFVYVLGGGGGPGGWHSKAHTVTNGYISSSIHYLWYS